MLAAGSPSVSIWSALIGLALILLSAGVTWVVWGGKRGSGLSDFQDKTINAYRAELDLANQRIESLTKQVDTQNAQIQMLQDMVLQVSKIDGLRKDVEEGFVAVTQRLEKLGAH